MSWIFYVFLMNSALFAFIFTIWSKKDLLNILIKLLFFFAVVINVIFCYQATLI